MKTFSRLGTLSTCFGDFLLANGLSYSAKNWHKREVYNINFFGQISTHFLQPFKFSINKNWIFSTFYLKVLNQENLTSYIGGALASRFRFKPLILWDKYNNICKGGFNRCQTLCLPETSTGKWPLVRVRKGTIFNLFFFIPFTKYFTISLIALYYFEKY